MIDTAASGSTQPHLDLDPLVGPIDRVALEAFVAESKASDRPWRRMTTGLVRPRVAEIAVRVLPLVIPVAVVVFLAVRGGSPLRSAVWRASSQAPFPFTLIPVVGAALLAVGALVLVARIVRLLRALIVPRSWWEAAFRLVGFAAANGLRYGHDETPAYAGLIFGVGDDRTVERRLTTTAGRRVEIGNYRYVVRGSDSAGSDDDVRVYGWGYVAITLDRRLPHLLLDAKANDRSVFGLRTSNLPVDLAPDQRLSLGGEFDDRFTLYAPSDYGRDAFGIFTPDVMALFIDRLGAFDVEIVDDTLFCYGPRFDLLSPTTYVWLQDLVGVVVARTVRRTARYRDDFALLEPDPRARQPPAVRPSPAQATGGTPVFAFAGDGPPETAANAIGSRGRRLRRRRWGAASVFGLLLVAAWLYNGVVAPVLGLPHLPDR